MTVIKNRKKLLLIMNPKSGLMLAPKYLAEITESFSRAGYLSTVLMTEAKGDAREFAAAYAGDADVVVVSGGDGTLNEVIDGLISAGIKTPIGYIPSGSTNDFANSLGLSKNIFESLNTVVKGKPVPVDIGSFNGRYFSYVASFGAFTSATYSVPQNLKNIFGHAAYVLGGIKELANIKPIHARMTINQGTDKELVREGDYVMGLICNSRSIGGILNLKRLKVDMSDGVMEVLMVKMPGDIIALNDIAVNMLAGTFKSDQIETYTASDIRMEIDKNTHWTLDGEYEEGSNACDIKIIPQAIQIIK